MAAPERRLLARLIDGLLLLPIYGGVVTLAVLLVAPHAGPIFPRAESDSVRVPGYDWIELGVVASLLVAGVAQVAYETVATVRYGRSLGKAALHIRPVRVSGAALEWRHAMGRAAIFSLAGIFSNWIGPIVDCVWCLGDEDRQCLHDKVGDTIVVND